MNSNKLRLFARFSQRGVLHREEVKNDPDALVRLSRAGFVQKVFRSGRVFYELTPASLLLLEQHRKKMLEEVKLRAMLEKNNPHLSSLLSDVRFLDEKNPVAREFLFLGDWQLTRPVVLSQLELAKLRFYQKVPERRRKKAA